MIRKFWKWMTGRGDEATTECRGPRERRVLVLQFGALGGAAMSEPERAVAVQAGKDGPAFRAAAQVVQDYFLNAQAMTLWDQRIADGTSGTYAMAQSYLADVLADLSDMAEGRVPERAGAGERKKVVAGMKRAEGGGKRRGVGSGGEKGSDGVVE